jgi:hypothetical protein
VTILLIRGFTKENMISSLRQSPSPFFPREFRPLIPLKTTHSFTSLTVIGMTKKMCNNNHFDYEYIEEDKMVKHAVTRLKGHAALWLDELQVDHRCKGKHKITRWDRMVAKIKEKFIPKDYQINMFRRLQNLRQKILSVKAYIEEFYRLNIRAGHKENEDEKKSRYINGLRYEIQEEISMMSVSKVEDAYQVALKDEEKLARK